jgi:hypothetical protein
MSSSPKPPPIPRKAQVNVPAIDGDPAIGDDTELSSADVGDDTALTVGDATELTARPSLAGMKQRGSDTAIDRLPDRPSIGDLTDVTRQVDDSTLDETGED